VMDVGDTREVVGGDVGLDALGEAAFAVGAAARIIGDSGGGAGASATRTGMLAPPPSPMLSDAVLMDVLLDGDARPPSLYDPLPFVPVQLTARGSSARVRAPRKQPSPRRLPVENPTPRCKRVWYRCRSCGASNHVRRIFCASCICPRRR